MSLTLEQSCYNLHTTYICNMLDATPIMNQLFGIQMLGIQVVQYMNPKLT